MTKKELLEEKIKLCESQVDVLKDEIEKLKTELNKPAEDEIPDLPEFYKGDVVWYMNSVFDIGNYTKDETPKIKEYNNFHTEEYVREYAEKSREIAMLLHCKWYIDKNYVPDWSDTSDEIKYCVTYIHNKNEEGYIPDSFYETEYSTIYFSTKQAAQKAADWMNKHYKRNKEN